MKNLGKFIGVYPVTKTLRFELRPVGKTQEWIEKAQEVESDEKKAQDYPKVKAIIDEYHKVCLRESLKNARFDWLPLADAILTFQKEKSEEAKGNLEKEQTKMRKQIVKAIEKFEDYKELTAPTPKNLLTSILPHHYDSESLASFKGFNTYFKGFQKNRNNIYSAEAISTSAPYRLVHDNFPKFLSNAQIYESIKTTCPEILEQAATELQPFLEGVQLDDVFSLDFYNSLLTQDGIDFFNRIIGGVTEESGQKYRGINEFSNLYRQQHPEVSGKKKAMTMIPLFKQILSDRETLSYIPEKIENDRQLVESITQFHSHITNCEKNGTTINVLNELACLLGKIDTFNPENIFISASRITDISQTLYGRWSAINDKLNDIAIEKFGDIQVAKNKKKIDAYLKKDAFSLSELRFDGCHSLSTYFSQLPQMVNAVNGYWLQFREWQKKEEQAFRNNPAGTEVVKNLLDSFLAILHKCAPLVVPEDYDTDKDFYNDFLPLYSELKNIVVLYNRVRNYLTQKPSDIKKFKLNFGIPTLADGWDKNKEKDNKAILLLKDGYYYLGIMKKPLNFSVKTKASEASYLKMECKLLAKPYMDLPHKFFAKKNIKQFSPSQRIIDIREGRYYKNTSSQFSSDILHEFINFYKDSISRYDDWNKFGFVFSPTDSYKSIGDFYNEIALQAYRMQFTELPVSKVDEWIDNGMLYLFQLHNKDYAEGAHGRKNLHTLYWESLFSEENLNDLGVRLNSEAELFYRPQSIKNKEQINHKVGSKMLNKRDKSGMPIPDLIYRKLYQYYNGRIKKDELTAAEQQYLDQVIVKDVKHDIIKDRRYTKPEFFFHVPITFNAKTSEKKSINKEVLEYLKDNPDINIIGIDRGERHLIYLTLINQRGEILKQKTFNTVGDYNYHAKLEQREKEREEARQSWQSIGKIKDLKEGFLSAVIHEIAVMMVEHNAIVVLEDLNFGFKRGRFKVERQVYQKFEKMLIDKLNYLSFKDRKADEEGGILRGYQLASFQRLGKQSGFLFYVPAAYTSKIDPVTGFVNHFNFNDITNAEKKKEFFLKMERIEMKDGHVEFEFDYRKFKTYQTDYQNVWTVSTYGKRIVIQTDDNGHKRMTDYHPTAHIIKAFKDKGITLSDGADIKALLADTGADIKNAVLFKDVFYAFQKTLQMRNSNAATEEDYILSPVVKDGHHFCSTDEADKGRDALGNWVSKLPVDADANGAYHIALKGLFLLKNPGIKRIENKKWFEFMVKKPYVG